MKILFPILLIFFLALDNSIVLGQDGNVADYREKIQVYTDRDVYISGENLLFSLYLRNDQPEQETLSKYAYLVIRDAQNKHVADLRMKLEGDRFSSKIYLPDTLKTGYYQIVSFTNFMRNKSEDFFFTKELIIANRFDNKLDALNFSTDSAEQSQASSDNAIRFLSTEKSYHSREKVKIEISLPPGIKENANVSIVVREQQYRENLSDRPGESLIRQADFSSHKERINELIHYYPESKGIFISGNIVNSDGIPLPDRRVMLFTSDSVANMKFNITDEYGKFSILLTEYYYGRKIIIRLENNEDAIISLDNKFKLKNPYIQTGKMLPSHLKNYIEQSQSVVKILKAFPINFSEKVMPINNHVNIPLVYTNFDAEVNPAEYQELNTFTEIARELLPGVQIRERNGIYTSSIYNSNSRFYFTYPPGIFLDGVLIDEVSQIISLGTEKILRVEYIMKERFVGDISMKGILSVYTKDGEVNKLDFKTPFTNEIFLPNSPSVDIFEGLVYDNPNSLKSPKPDLRQTLYWIGNLEMSPGENKSIDFYCSDLDGKYEVIVNGISYSGQNFTIQSSFEVVTTSR